MRTVIVIFLAGLACAAAPVRAGADTDSPAGRFAAYMGGVLELTKLDCPEQARPAEGQVARCHRFAGDFGDWKISWEVNLRRFELPESPVSRGPWSTRAVADGVYRRTYGFGDDELDVRFEERDGLVVFSFPWEGPDDAEDQAGGPPGARLAGFAGVGIPEPIQQPAPAYPAAAEGSGITGQVALQVVVDDTGNVGEIEILREEPTRKGFADHAIAAVKRWRYQPVMIDGSPVPVRLPVYVTIPPPAEVE